MVYIVTYDLKNGSGSDYEELLSLIKGCGIWARLSESSYLIDSEETPVQLRDKYKGALKKGDKLYVGAIDAPAAWTGYSNDVSKWIKCKL